uniref:Uncharacterized protein n=1 Tax=Globodera rostochiensis TaxID=31243 RepID=A0A914I7E1_GLORO
MHSNINNFRQTQRRFALLECANIFCSFSILALCGCHPEGISAEIGHSNGTSVGGHKCLCSLCCGGWVVTLGVRTRVNRRSPVALGNIAGEPRDPEAVICESVDAARTVGTNTHHWHSSCAEVSRAVPEGPICIASHRIGPILWLAPISRRSGRDKVVWDSAAERIGWMDGKKREQINYSRDEMPVPEAKEETMGDCGLRASVQSTESAIIVKNANKK